MSFFTLACCRWVGLVSGGAPGVNTLSKNQKGRKFQHYFCFREASLRNPLVICNCKSCGEDSFVRSIPIVDKPSMEGELVMEDKGAAADGYGPFVGK